VCVFMLFRRAPLHARAEEDDFHPLPRQCPGLPLKKGDTPAKVSASSCRLIATNFSRRLSPVRGAACFYFVFSERRPGRGQNAIAEIRRDGPPGIPARCLRGPPGYPSSPSGPRGHTRFSPFLGNVVTGPPRVDCALNAESRDLETVEVRP
jgi:hypothetical protein